MSRFALVIGSFALLFAALAFICFRTACILSSVDCISSIRWWIVAIVCASGTPPPVEDVRVLPAIMRLCMDLGVPPGVVTGGKLWAITPVTAKVTAKITRIADAFFNLISISLSIAM